MSVARRALPHGSWPTPITSEVVVAESVQVSELRVDGEHVYWSESRPSEGGRTVVVRRSPDGDVEELLAPDQNARTAVHEYGGGAWWVDRGVVWFSSWSDQRLYRLDPSAADAAPLTPEPAVPRGDRYADGALDPDGRWIVCVRERHPARGRGAVDVRNEIVRLAAHEASEPEVVVSGPDFVASPRVSPDGARLCWVEWDHPHMPWDETRLWVRELDSGEELLVAGGPQESVSEPQWQRDGSLTFISDRTGWWNLYRWDGGRRTVAPLTQLDAEIGIPMWTLGASRYAVLDDGTVVFARWRRGIDGLAARTPDGEIAELEAPFTLVRSIRALRETTVAVLAATPAEKAGVFELDVRGGAARSRRPIRASHRLTDAGIEPGYLSLPEPVSFPSEGGREAHGLLYRPVNPGCDGPRDQPPPLLVEVHGGPTSAARPELDLEVQYWTSRGFAFLDLNYGGSTGYGRAYRDLLRGAWGIVDVEDAICAAQWAARRRLADPARICIRGGSAGGFTTLAALARAETPFAAGADYFGVADLEALARETHKFESRYLDTLVGPYPQARRVYRERSPIQHVDEFARPLIVLQGLEDEVVPPNQATMIVEALRTRGIPVAYVPLAGEQHGFRRGESIRRALDAELSFYAQILGFELPEDEGIEPVPIS